MLSMLVDIYVAFKAGIRTNMKQRKWQDVSHAHTFHTALQVYSHETSLS